MSRSEPDPLPHEHACAPCAEALVAGTVALMTAWADPCLHARLDPDEQRALIARKVVSNLHLLRAHPALSCGLRQVMAMAHERWVGLARQAEPPVVGPLTDASARVH